MVRTTSSRTSNTVHAIYKQRSSVYSKRPGYIDLLNIAELFSASGSTQSREKESVFVLPPKQPTPNVILRSDIMPKQRTHSVL